MKVIATHEKGRVALFSGGTEGFLVMHNDGRLWSVLPADGAWECSVGQDNPDKTADGSLRATADDWFRSLIGDPR